MAEHFDFIRDQGRDLMAAIKRAEQAEARVAELEAERDELQARLKASEISNGLLLDAKNFWCDKAQEALKGTQG